MATPETTTPTQWLTSAEAGQRLGVTAKTIKTWADRGDLPFGRTLGGHRRFNPADIDQLAKQLRTTGGDP